MHLPGPPNSAKLQCGHDPKAVENSAVGPDQSLRSRRFNAATTRRPWRTSTHEDRQDAAAAASMRPRPEGRGEPGSPSRHSRLSVVASMRPRPEGRGEPGQRESVTPRPLALQCGHDPKAVENLARIYAVGASLHGFNAATTRRPWRTRRLRGAKVDTRPASMRPRPEGRGEQSNPPSCVSASHRASMRPRPEGRGEPGRDQHAVKLVEASMRPRPEGRGEPSRQPDAVFTQRLQCGHDPKAVENQVDDLFVRAGKTGFNAATTRRPWRTARVTSG